MRYLEQNFPAGVEIARDAYKCFEPHRKDEGQSYARALRFTPDSCEEEVLDLLTKIQQRVVKHLNDPEDAFSVEQNALITVNAEKYYRAMLSGGAAS